MSEPRIVEFVPSPDHSVALDDGMPVVTAYLLRLYQLGASAPFQTTDMGKPPVQSDGWIRYDFSAQIAGWPLPGGSYEARVDAVGPYGDALSGASDPFTANTPETPTCTFTLSELSTSVGSSSGTGTAMLSTADACGWSASSSASWLTVQPTSGAGPATISYVFSANTSTTSRSAKVAVGGSVLTVTQAGTACSYSVSPTSRALGPASRTDYVTVTTRTGCRWRASSAVPWITLARTSGYGSATVKYAVGSNRSSSSRSGAFTVAGRTVRVTQAGSCTYVLSRSSTTFGRAGGTGRVGLMTGPACTWTVASSASWLIPGRTSGKGAATIGYTATVNRSGSRRYASLRIGRDTLAVTQTACIYRLSKYTTSIASRGGTGSVGLTTAGSCTWRVTSSAAWLVPGRTRGTGAATIRYSAVANPSRTSRSASLRIGGRRLVVSQPGRR